MSLRDTLARHLRASAGVLVAKSAIVARESYSGRSIIAPNTNPEDADERGYLPVELWIMSMVESKSRLARQGEGLTKISIDGTEYSLKELAQAGEELLFGSYRTCWPLAKILDIGGVPTKSSFGTVEVPPGAVEVHRGAIVNGRATGLGKTEAYFYLPKRTEGDDSATLRLGFKSGVTKERVIEALKHFGADDSMYELLNEFKVETKTGWTVPSGLVHAAAAHVTFEIQVPQDWYNALTWKFGKRLEEDKRKAAFSEKSLKGLKDEQAFIDELIDWELSTSQALTGKYFHTPARVSSGKWGTRSRVFFGNFYGEEWEVLPGQSMHVPASEVPRAGIVWRGEGTINGIPLTMHGKNEFLAVPHTTIQIQNKGRETLSLYTFEPLQSYGF